MNLKYNVLIFLISLGYSTPIVSDQKTITLFSHGIADTYKQAYQYAKSYKKGGIIHYNERFLFQTPFVSFNYPDAIDAFYRVNWAETSFGQENEIGRLHLAYQWITDNHDNCDIILWGLSRGASNIGIYAGRHAHTNVKAIVLESPYYTMTEVIESMMHKFNLAFLPISYGETVTEFIFKKYVRNGFTPENSIENIAQDMPILIICSQEDVLVPTSSSINVYKKLIKTGHKNSYIFITEKGKHAKILQGPDGEKYQHVVNAFYKKYNLPHCPSSAALGEDLLAACQPIF